MKTLKNKLVSLAMILGGLVVTSLSEDATALIFISIIAIPLFFARKDWLAD